ncbi:MAG: efflux RND transporter permease subunit, partial [Rhodospirillales bacterium]|nr:efflux RND transporter permease subunit [Rhodospirillales bacterium]
MISALFIRRPRLAIVIAIVTTIAGLIALTRMPVAQLPDIVPPQVVVSTTYPGASAQTVESSVAEPIEAAVNGVDHMIYMQSTSANDGSYSLSVSFDLGSSSDIDTVNVNNRVQAALSQLPAEVQAEGVTVAKKSSAILMFVGFYGDRPDQTPLFVANYVLIHALDAVARVPGVGQANLFSRLNYSMRVWFHTDRLVALGLTPQDIVNA